MFSIYAVKSTDFSRLLQWDTYRLTVRAPHRETAEDQGLPESITVFKTERGLLVVVEEDQLGRFLADNVRDLVREYIADHRSIAETQAACSCGESENYRLDCPVHGFGVEVFQ